MGIITTSSAPKTLSSGKTQTKGKGKMTKKNVKMGTGKPGVTMRATGKKTKGKKKTTLTGQAGKAERNIRKMSKRASKY